VNHVRAALAAYASLVFSASPIAGALMLAAAVTGPAYGLGGLGALAAAHATAHAFGYRRESVAAGYYGYSAILVGLALAARHGIDGRLVLLVGLGGIGATLATAVLGDALHRGAGVPALALPFVIVASVFGPALAPELVHCAWDPALVALPGSIDLALRALGGIVFAPTPLAGILVLAALVAASRIAAAVSLAGIAVALLVCAALDSPHAVALGAAYNAALAALAIGAACFVPGRAALAAALATAALTAAFTAGLAPLLATWGLPLYAWPFTLVGLAVIRALHLRAPGSAPIAAPLPGASPERNLDYVAGGSRFGLPGPPQLALPFYGTWAITQGVDGAHTHKAQWADALDFEVLDEQGFPFRGDGLALADYRCFHLPVLAPASGVVAAVHDGALDNPPGEVDTDRPWGNAVVIAMGEGLYAVVAHLAQGSVRVAVGQSVVAGQPVAACGSSGRSPRPHVHLQVQRSIVLGAPAEPFRLSHYLVDGSRYVAVGVPREGERVQRPVPSPFVEAFTALPVGGELGFTLEGGATLRLRSELGLHGERYLRDLERGDRLYFTVQDGSLAFTAHVGPADAPLRALFRALPRLPSVAGVASLVDHPPASSLLGWPVRALHDVARVIGDPVEARADIALREEPDAVTITTSIGVGLRGRVRPRYKGTVEIDRAGLRALTLIDERRRGAVLLRARRTV
jgi:urea transporter